MAESALNALAQFNDAVSRKQTINEDSADHAQALWYQVNWSNLITPAPNTLSTLAQLTYIGYATDFELEKPDGKTSFEHLKNTSFRAAIQQIRSASYDAFSCSYVNMTSIKSGCQTLQEHITTIISFIYPQEDPSYTQEQWNSDVLQMVPIYLKNIQKESDRCSSLANEITRKFLDVLGAVTELNTQSTATQSAAEKKASSAALEAQITQMRIDALRKNEEKQAQNIEFLKSAVEKADARYNTSLDEMPTGGQLLLYNLGEKATSALASAGTMLMKKKLAGTQAQEADLDDALSQALGNKDLSGQKASTSSATKISSTSATEAIDPKKLTKGLKDELDDPIFMDADHIREIVFMFHNCLTSKEGSPDWDGMKLSDTTTKTGLGYVNKALTQLSSEKYGSFEVAQKGKNIVSRSSELVKTILEFQPMNKRSDPQVTSIIAEVARLKSSSIDLATTVLGKSGETALQNPMIVEEDPPEEHNESNPSIAKLAVESAQFKVKSTAQQLEKAHEMYQTAQKDMMSIVEQMADFTGQLTKLTSQKVDWDEISKTLIYAIGHLSKLVLHLQKLESFFAILSSTIMETLNGAFKTFQELVDGTVVDTSKKGGRISEMTRRTLLKQASGANKIQHVVQSISDVYIRIYEQHIQEGMKLLSDLPSVIDKKDEAAVTGTARTCDELKTWCNGLAQQLLVIIGQESDDFESKMKQRMVDFNENFKPMLESTPPEMTKAIIAGAETVSQTATKVTVTMATRRRPPPVLKMG